MFYEEMEKVVPWVVLVERIAPYYRRGKNWVPRAQSANHVARVLHATVDDATLIDAPSSTKNKDHKRDPDMHPLRLH